MDSSCSGPYETKREIAEAAIGHHNFVIYKSSGTVYSILKITNELVFFNDAAYTYKEFYEKFMWFNYEACGRINWGQF